MIAKKIKHTLPYMLPLFIVAFVWLLWHNEYGKFKVVDLGVDLKKLDSTEQECIRKLVNLGARIRIDKSGKAITVDLSGSDVTDQDIACFTVFTRVIAIDVSHTEISPEAIKYISKIQSLERLILPRISKKWLKSDKISVGESLRGVFVTDSKAGHVLDVYGAR